MEKKEKKYPIGGYAPGHYHCICINCNATFIGDKRAVQCEPCATKTLKEMEKEEMLRRLKQIGDLLNYELGTDSYNQRCAIHDAIEYINSTPPNLDKEKILSEYIKWVDKVSEDIEEKSHFTPQEIVYKICEIIQATTPPNLDNLLELAREEAERRVGDKNILKWQLEIKAFEQGAKFIINKLKELGK